MARMHARKRGKSGSDRPVVKENPEWVEADTNKVTELVVKLAKQGKSSSEIGIVLRDQYAIPDQKLITGKSVTEIMKEEGVYPDLPEDLLDLMEKAVNLHEHVERHRKDVSNKRGLQLIESKIRRLVKYYIREGVLPEGWKYSRERAEMLTQ
ncbi:MAG: 30S ribosomal protein S15 [Thermoplasmata archaeon]